MQIHYSQPAVLPGPLLGRQLLIIKVTTPSCKQCLICVRVSAALLQPFGPGAAVPPHTPCKMVQWWMVQIFPENTGLKLQRRAYIVWDNDGPQRVLLVKKVDDQAASLMLEEIGKWWATPTGSSVQGGLVLSLWLLLKIPDIKNREKCQSAGWLSVVALHQAGSDP